MAAAGPPAAAVAAPGAIARLVAGGVAPPMPGPAPNLNVVTGDLTDLMPPASGAMVDSKVGINRLGHENRPWGEITPF